MSTVSLSETYRNLLDQPSDVQAHLPTMVALVEALDAQRVCELGVRHGVSTVAWLEGLRRTGGHLWAVDIEPCGVEHRQLTFVRGDDCSEEVLAQIPDDLDIVFVDSSHLFVHTRREIELYVPKLAEGGAIVFHDVDVERFDHHPDDEVPYPVRCAVEEAASDGDWTVDWHHDTCGWNPDDGFDGSSVGLAVCWPPTEETS